MRLNQIKTSIKVSLSIFFLVFLVVSFSNKAHAATTRPIFKVHGNDVFVGGAYPYNLSGSSCNTDDPNYQAAYHNGVQDALYKGAILSFANNSTNTGSSSDFGAIALGLVENGGRYGFVSYRLDPTSHNKLTFANYSVPGWGGSFSASASPLKHCLIDYYGTQQDQPINSIASGSFNPGAPNGYYKFGYSSPAYTLFGGAGGGTVNISKSQQFVVFAPGNVYINQNIAYDPSDVVGQSSSFVLVACGDIYIDPAVVHLDGWYIAQTSVSGQCGDGTAGDGTVWTCHDANPADNPDTAYIAACNQHLTVGGGIYAQKINLLRTPTDSDMANNTPAEDIRAIPETSLSQPFFQSTTGSGNFSIDSVVSLPPIY